MKKTPWYEDDRNWFLETKKPYRVRKGFDHEIPFLFGKNIPIYSVLSVMTEAVYLMVIPVKKANGFAKLPGALFPGGLRFYIPKVDSQIELVSEKEAFDYMDDLLRRLETVKNPQEEADFDKFIGDMAKESVEEFKDSSSVMRVWNGRGVGGGLLPPNTLLHERVWALAKNHIEFARRCVPPHITEEDIAESKREWNDYAESRGENFSSLDYTFPFYWALAESAQRAAINPYDYAEYAFLNNIYAILISRAIYDIGGSPDDALKLASATTQQYYHIVNHRRAGGRVYEVAPGLAAQLAETELRGLLCDDVNLPYESICLAAPPETGLQVWNGDTGWHPLEAIYILESREEDGTRRWRLLLSGKSKVADNPFDDALIYFSFELVDGKKISEICEKVDEKLRSVESASPGAVGPMTEVWLRVFQWALNVVIYATWPDAEREHVQLDKEAKHLWDRIKKIPKGPKRDRLKKDYAKLDPRNRVRLGKSVVYISRDKAILEDHEHSKRVGAPLTLRIRVQGHWKKQFHGPKRALRKLIWIQPYWKGPEYGVLSQAVHRLSGTTERSTPPHEKEVVNENKD